MALPPLVADHPSNVNPVRVGALGADAIEPPEANDPAVTAEPPFELYVTAYDPGLTVIVVALEETAE